MTRRPQLAIARRRKDFSVSEYRSLAAPESWTLPRKADTPGFCCASFYARDVAKEEIVLKTAHLHYLLSLEFGFKPRDAHSWNSKKFELVREI